VKRWAAVAGLAILAALVADGAVRSVRRFVADRLFNEARELQILRRRPEAAERLESALRWDPGRYEIARRAGDLYREWWEDQAGVLKDRGRGVLQKAITCYLQGIHALPSDAWAWSGVGESYAHLADLQKTSLSLDTFTRTGRDRLGPEQRVALGGLEMAVDLEPAGYDYHDQLALLLASFGLRTEALSHFRRSAELMPFYHQHAWPIPDRLDADTAAAITAGLESAVDTNRFIPRDEMLRTLGEMASQRADWPRAESALGLAIQAAREEGYARVLKHVLGEILMRQGKDAKALELFATSMREPVVAAGSRMNRGIILLRQGRFEDAFSELRQSAALKPDDSFIRLLLASAAEATGRSGLAEESLQTASRLAPSSPEPIRRLYELYRQNGDLVQAAAAARRLVEGWPQVPDYRRMLADVDAGTR